MVIEQVIAVVPYENQYCAAHSLEVKEGVYSQKSHMCDITCSLHSCRLERARSIPTTLNLVEAYGYYGPYAPQPAVSSASPHKRE